MNILLRPLDEKDFPLMLRWLKMPHVRAWWDGDISWSLELVRKKYDLYIKGYKLENSVAKPIRAYIICVDEIPVGYIQIYNAHDFNRETSLKGLGLPQKLAALDIFVGEECYLKRGIASKAITQLLEKQDDFYTHAFVNPDITNKAAIRAYQKAGFREITMQPNKNELWMIQEIVGSQ